jgi:hypothetical protein
MMRSAAGAVPKRRFSPKRCFRQDVAVDWDPIDVPGRFLATCFGEGAYRDFMLRIALSESGDRVTQMTAHGPNADALVLPEAVLWRSSPGRLVRCGNSNHRANARSNVPSEESRSMSAKISRATEMIGASCERAADMRCSLEWFLSPGAMGGLERCREVRAVEAFVWVARQAADGM